MDNGLLIAARETYTEELQDILHLSIYDGIKKIWTNCKTEDKKSPLKLFQSRLCLIPEWNQEVINDYYKKILKLSDMSEEYLDKIIEAVFLSNIKILSVVKLQAKKQVININVPETKNFIHKCFIETARQFYADPHLIDDRDIAAPTEIARNVKRSSRIIRDSIEKTIRNSIPMEEILNKYLDSHEDEVIKSSSSGEESDDGDTPKDFPSVPQSAAEIPPPIDTPVDTPVPPPIPPPIPPPVDINDIFYSNPGAPENRDDTVDTVETIKEEPTLRIDLNKPTEPVYNYNEEENFFSDSD